MRRGEGGWRGRGGEGRRGRGAAAAAFRLLILTTVVSTALSFTAGFLFYFQSVRTLEKHVDESGGEGAPTQVGGAPAPSTTTC